MTGSLGEYLVEETREEVMEEFMEEMTANMLKEKISYDIISRVTGLSIDQITAIGKMRGLL